MEGKPDVRRNDDLYDLLIEVKNSLLVLIERLEVMSSELRREQATSQKE